MNEPGIRDMLTDVFRQVLRDETLELRDDMSDWDSVLYLKLVVAIESAFSIRFTTSDVQHSKSVREMVRTITARLGARSP
jgi:acyl carrier protein